MELIDVNPASKLKRLDKAEAYKAWSDEECATFEASNPPRALLTAYMLGRYTGQRGGDIFGATEKEIMAWLGHATPAMAAHYSKMAELKKLAAPAGSKWMASELHLTRPCKGDKSV
jgi:hypothetical protein